MLCYTAIGISQDTNTVTLHMQVYDNGICLPMTPSIYYSTSRFQQSKSVFECGSYYSTVYAYVKAKDSSHLLPQSNHLTQSGSLKFNPKLDYELIFLQYEGYNRVSPDTMTIQISKLDKDAQITLPFKKGKFNLKKMPLFSELKKAASPVFLPLESKDFKKSLKLDSTAYFANGDKKAKYYIVAQNFPLYFVQEFDSIHSNNYSQGFRLLSAYNIPGGIAYGQAVWANGDVTKYGYWEYFENDIRIKHELWASSLWQQFETYPSGQLKSETHYGHPNQEVMHFHYLENGKIKEEYHKQSSTHNPILKEYAYSPKGTLVLINSYKSTNGVTKQSLQKRELYYPSGSLKMEESFVGTYSIKYYNEDGTERIN